ncbi:exonuclease domain-containing protein, partial [Ruthenibacterium lactatiformans]
VLCLDIETTGFFAPDDEILSLSIIDGTNAVRFHSYFCPEHNDSWPEAEAVNGISPASVRQAPLLRERKAEIDELLVSAHALVGYNLCSFDLPFMEASGICCPDTAVCDVMLDYAFVNHEWDDGYGDWKWQKLTACAANYNYPYQAHNSLEDARATLYCARKVAESMVAINQAFQRMSDPAIQP